MQMKKRVLSAFMALCMVCSLVGAAWAVIPQVSAAVSGVTIENSISTDGLLTANLQGTPGPTDSVTYTWYRSETGAEGTWQKVELQRVTGTQDNIVNDGQSVNVAYDSIAANAENSERYWYYVTATVTSNGDSEVYTAEPLQVPYYIELQNGSFEAPVADHWNNQVSNGTESLIWQTTGEGSGNHDGADVEIVRSTTDERFRDGNQWKTYQQKVQEIYSPSGAADGVQFAELNCEAYGALYQDVLTVPGVDLNWYLEHCARQGTDTMALVIMPATEAYELTQRLENIANGSGSNDSKAQQIRTALDGVASDSSVFVDYYQAGTGTWKYHNGTYTVPANQYLTRFFFVAVSTGSGNATVGNLLDNVGFGTDVPEPQKDQGILTVTKYVDGYVPGSDYSVTVNAGDESFTFNDFRLDSVTGKYYASHTFTYQMQAYATQIVTVSETVSGAPTDYTATSTVAVGGGQATTGQSTPATITAGATQTVTFTNTYKKLEPLTPEHNKYIKDNGDGTYDLSLNVTGTISESTETIPINVLYVLDESYSMMWTMDGDYPDKENGKTGSNPSGDNKYPNDDSNEEPYEYSFERYEAMLDAMDELNTTLKNNSSLDVQVALVEFAGSTAGVEGNTQQQRIDWMPLANANLPSEEDVKWENFATGTNYGAAIHDAKDVLNKIPQERQDAETVVIFITDGEPNRAAYNTSSTSGDAMEYATDEIAGLEADRFYAIGVGDDKFEKNLEDLVAAIDKDNVPRSDYFKSSDREALVDYFKGIAATITSVDCTNVVITDQLSDYAELVDETKAPTITIQPLTGQPIQVVITNYAQSNDGIYTGTGTFTSNNKPQTLTYTYNSGTKTFTLEFPDTYALENGWTYTITVKIQPTDKAYSDYAANIAQADNNGYGDMVGDSGTDAPGNDTSSGKPGFYSNTEANLTYDSNGVEDVKEEYPKPVIQVKLGDLTLAKQVNGLENGDNANNEQFTFIVTGPKTAVGYQGFVAGANNTAMKQVTVTPGNSVTLNNLPYGTYTVTENDPANEIVNEKYYFVGSSSTATNNQVTVGATNATVTITNTYAPYRTVTITKDVGGNMGVTDYPFNFTTSITLKDGKEYSLTQSTQTNATLRGNTTGEGATATWTDSGYTLADGDILTITKLKDGDVITLQETDGNSNGYSTVYKVDGETDPLTVDEETGNATHTVAGDANIIVTNERNVGTPTGFFEDNLPFTLMISAAGLAGIALIATILVRRQRRRRE